MLLENIFSEKYITCGNNILPMKLGLYSLSNKVMKFVYDEHLINRINPDLS